MKPTLLATDETERGPLPSGLSTQPGPAGSLLRPGPKSPRRAELFSELVDRPRTSSVASSDLAIGAENRYVTSADEHPW